MLTEDLLALPDAVRELVAAEQRTEARLEALAEQVAALVAAQQRTDAQLAALGVQVATLTAAQERTEVRVGRMEGSVLEIRFINRAPAYLGSAGLHRVRVVPTADWVDAMDDALDAGRVNSTQRLDLLRADAVFRARDDQGEVWLAVEVSATVDTHDVARAQRWAAVLALLQGRARPCVAGYVFTMGARTQLATDPTALALTLPED